MELALDTNFVLLVNEVCLRLHGHLASLVALTNRASAISSRTELAMAYGVVLLVMKDIEAALAVAQSHLEVVVVLLDAQFLVKQVGLVSEAIRHDLVHPHVGRVQVIVNHDVLDSRLVKLNLDLTAIPDTVEVTWPDSAAVVV